MPRYYFHVIDGRSIIDNEGSELAGLRQARVEAIQLAGAILRDEGDTFWKGEQWHMNVTDASGRSVLKLHFSADDQGIAPDEDREIRELPPVGRGAPHAPRLLPCDRRPQHHRQ
jgi:hypothetical protein